MDRVAESHLSDASVAVCTIFSERLVDHLGGGVMKKIYRLGQVRMIITILLAHERGEWNHIARDSPGRITPLLSRSEHAQPGRQHAHPSTPLSKHKYANGKIAVEYDGWVDLGHPLGEGDVC